MRQTVMLNLCVLEITPEVLIKKGYSQNMFLNYVLCKIMTLNAWATKQTGTKCFICLKCFILFEMFHFVSMGT